MALIVELLLALVKLFGVSASSANAARERETGAALQREQDMRNEEIRIAAAARAGLAVDGLPNGHDALDRDGKS
jgi:hypothetical protein